MLMQRHAYEENRGKFLTTTRHRLPIELTESVFQLTLAAENILSDRQLIAHAFTIMMNALPEDEAVLSVRKALMTELICPHSVQDGVGRCRQAKSPVTSRPNLIRWNRGHSGLPVESSSPVTMTRNVGRQTRNVRTLFARRVWRLSVTEIFVSTKSCEESNMMSSAPIISHQSHSMTPSLCQAS